MVASYANPYKPGAGHSPPYLAGRTQERTEFERLLTQDTILENLVLTGLRGVGKTVLLDTFRPLAHEAGWLWVGTDMSEAASLTEDAIAKRLLADLAAVTSGIVFAVESYRGMGFVTSATTLQRKLDYAALCEIYDQTPGLASDKLKQVLEIAWGILSASSGKFVGLVFAYDEAQNLSDNAKQGQFPLSLLLDVFQSLQKRGVRFMLALTGLPTLFPKLVDARTFAERMFRVVTLDRLNVDESRDAVLRPLTSAQCPIQFDEEAVRLIVVSAGGYPYFLQFICRETFEALLVNAQLAGPAHPVPIEAITRKLDSDFFVGRWARITDRQRDLLMAAAIVVSRSKSDEFSVNDIVGISSDGSTQKPFSASHANQLLSKLYAIGLVYKNRYGRYAFAVPLFDQFILRQAPSPAFTS